MRPRNRKNAASLVEESELEKVARWRREDARKAAAWIVRRYRRTIRNLGALDLYLPKKGPMPPWMAHAIVALRASPKWAVEEKLRDDGGRGYRIVWLKRRKRG